MTPQLDETLRLLRLARRDEQAFLALLHAPEVPLSMALFHAQQAVEKALKAIMCLNGLPFRRTHDLEELAAQLCAAGHEPNLAQTELTRLTPYAVEYRYDDETPELLTGALALTMVDQLLAWADAQVAALG
jgi:HEPN domain-containing protein